MFETIPPPENLLLTFTNIGMAVFPQAMQVVLDMAEALRLAPNQTAMIVGKALNDPIVGIPALRRMGMNFTDEHTTQVKALVSAGDMAGAQTLILGDVTHELMTQGEG
jgi:hypothetical protein